MYVLHLPKSEESISESNRLPCDHSRWLLPDLVGVEKRNGICSLTDFFRCQPHNTRWMSPAERRLVQVRLAEDAGEADQNSSEATCVSDLELT